MVKIKKSLSSCGLFGTRQDVLHLDINKALLSGSIALLIGINLFNLVNFLFQFAMARMLSLADYGILATLFSIIYITSVFSEPVQTIIAKYSSKESQNGKLKNLALRSLKKGLKISSIIFIGYIFIAIPLSLVLKIPYLLVTLTGLTIFSAFLPPITRGVMQGRKFFKTLGTNLFLESIIKLALAIILVLIGWKVYGAITAAIVGSFFAFAFSLIALKEILKSREKKTTFKGIYSYSWPVFIVLFSVLAFFSLDIIIARIVFDAASAGYYAIASVLAKIIFLGTQPISKALFPVAAGEKKIKGHGLLVNAIVILFVCVLIALIIFYSFSGLLIRIFAGRIIIDSQNILFYLALAMSILSFTNLILLYKLSLNKTKNYLIFLIFPVIEGALLLLFSNNLIEYSIALITASAIFLWGAVLLFDR